MMEELRGDERSTTNSKPDTKHLKVNATLLASLLSINPSTVVANVNIHVYITNSFTS